MNAIVTVKFVLKNICDKKDLEDTSFEEMVKFLIDEEGLFNLCDDEYEIIKIEPC